MRKSQASLGRRVTLAVQAALPPVLIAAGILFAFQYWSAHSAGRSTGSALLTTNPATYAFAGTVSWRATDGGLAILAEVAIPVEGTHITLTFRKNTDATLPASHLIEVDTSELPGSRAGPIASIGELVAKSSPVAEGTPLVATVVDVTKTLFWIGLSPVSTDRAVNLRLMAANPFFGLPVTYASGEKAVVTFAKGQAGEAVFRKVMTAWGL